MKLREIIEHNVIQGSVEWGIVRTGRITGSHFADIMPAEKARSKWTKGQLTYLRKVAAEILTGISSDKEFSNGSMDHGTEMEPISREYLSDHLMVPIRECGFFEISEYAGSSPDGIIGDMDKVLEMKNPDSQTHLKYFLDPMELWKEYKWQVTGEMLATGIDQALLVSFDFRMDKSRCMVIVEPPAGYLDDIKRLEDRLGECTELIKGWIA